MELKSTNERQKRFCELYAENPDGTAAAIGAGYSAKTAASIASENLRKLELSKYIHALQEEASSSRIATIEEVKAFWSDVVRDKNAKHADRIRAAELLAKSAGAFAQARQDDAERKTEIERNRRNVIIYLPQRDQDPE